MRIFVVNNSKLVAPGALGLAVQAVQKQLSDHFSAAWERYVVIELADPAKGPPKEIDAFPLYVVDTATDADSLGWHDEKQGIVEVSPIYAEGGDDLTNHVCSVSSVLSHEVLEIAADAEVNDWWEAPDGRLLAAEVCLTGDTKISLMNGTERTIESLADEEEFWVYGCTPTGRIVSGRGHSARMTKRNAPIVEVELDDGQKIRCTPDHRFMLRDGTYLEASLLEPGTSLMPLYRRREYMRWAGEDIVDYEQVMTPETKSWEFTHQAVSAPVCPVGKMRHHVDFDRFNNEPTNITFVTQKKHRQLHQEHQRRLIADGRHPFQNPTSEKKARDSKRLAAYNRSEKHRAVAREVGRVAMSKLWEKPEFREHHQRRGTALLKAYNGSAKQIADHAAFLADPIKKASWTKKMKEIGRRPEVREKRRQNLVNVNASRTPEEKSRLGRLAMHLRWHERRGRIGVDCVFCKSPPNNHKVVAVQPAGRSDVWDITVDDVHNFALTAGVFVHNCDPVEASGYAIDVMGTPVMVSNFVRPAWKGATTSAPPYDYMATLSAPWTRSSGGYWIVRSPDGQPTAEFADAVPHWRRERVEKKIARGFGRFGRRRARMARAASGPRVSPTPFPSTKRSP